MARWLLSVWPYLTWSSNWQRKLVSSIGFPLASDYKPSGHLDAVSRPIERHETFGDRLSRPVYREVCLYPVERVTSINKIKRISCQFLHFPLKLVEESVASLSNFTKWLQRPLKAFRSRYGRCLLIELSLWQFFPLNIWGRVTFGAAGAIRILTYFYLGHELWSVVTFLFL